MADSFDAMGSDRPYRQGMPDEKLDDIIREGAGKQWDPTWSTRFSSPRRRPRNLRRPGEELETTLPTAENLG